MNDEERKTQIREKMAAKVATFVIGDEIQFLTTDDIELTGKILSITNSHAIVEHKYGICKAWLWISKKI